MQQKTNKKRTNKKVVVCVYASNIEKHGIIQYTWYTSSDKSKIQRHFLG